MLKKMTDAFISHCFLCNGMGRSKRGPKEPYLVRKLGEKCSPETGIVRKILT